jgi:hypothetical protein
MKGEEKKNCNSAASSRGEEGSETEYKALA